MDIDGLWDVSVNDNEHQIIPVSNIPYDLGANTLTYFEELASGGGAEVLLEPFIKRMLYNVSLIPAQGKGYDYNIRFIPGATLGGRIGPFPEHEVMIVGSMPGMVRSSSSMFGDALIEATQLHFGNNRAIVTAVLEETGIPKSEYDKFYVTNMVRFPRPTKSNKGGIRVAWIKECLHLLHQELRIIQPRLILCLGTQASKYFTNYVITKAQNHVFEYVINQHELDEAESNNMPIPDAITAKVVCAMDPKAVSANSENMPQFVSGVQLFSDLYKGKDVHSKKFDAFYIKNEDELTIVVDMLINSGATEFTVDCEWGGNHFMDAGAGLRTVQIGWSETATMVVVLREAGMNKVFKPHISSAAHHIRRLLQRPGVKVIGHNFSADFPWLYDIGIDLTEQFCFDTILASHLFEPTTSHVLEALAVKHIPGWARHDIELEEWKKKNPLKDGDGYGNIPDDILLPYSAADTCATFYLYKYYSGLFAQPANRAMHELFTSLVIPASRCFIDIEMTGIQMDKERLEVLEVQYRTVYDLLLHRLRVAIDDPGFNPNSSPQKVKLLYDTLKLTPVKTTGKYPMMWSEVLEREEEDRHDPAADGETLEILGAKDPVADLLREVCMLGTVLKVFLPPKSTDVKTGLEEYKSGLHGFIKIDGRLHTSIGQMVKTGRLSSSNPNLCNMPNKTEGSIEDIFGKYEDLYPDKFYKLRSAFVVKEGYLLVAADYKQAEIAALAYMSGDEGLIASVKAGDDIHSFVGRQMFEKMDLTNEEFKSQHKPLRISAKSLLFGLIYGRGAMAISREVEKSGVECSFDQAKAFIAQFMDKFPKVKELIDRTHEQVESQGYVEGVWGRRAFYYTTGVAGSEADAALARQQRQSVNFLPQNYVGELLRKTLINVFNYKHANPEVDMNVVLTVYDSVMYEVAIKDVEHVVNTVIPQCMTTESFCHKLPFNIDIDIDVSQRWDEKNTPTELKELGLSKEFSEKYGKEKDDGIQE